MGIEPTLFAWEARVLPLNDARQYRYFNQLGTELRFATVCPASILFLNIPNAKVLDFHIVVHAEV